MNTTDQPEVINMLQTGSLVNAFARVCMVYGLLNDLDDDNSPGYTRRLEWLQSETMALARITEQLYGQRKQEVLDNELQ